MDASSSMALLGFIAACFLAAMTGAFFRPGEWYKRLKKPSWRPPNRLFAPVWTILYVMIAISGWLVWQEAGVDGAAFRWRSTPFSSCSTLRGRRYFLACTVPISGSWTLFWSGCRLS